MNQYELSLKIMTLLANRMICAVHYDWSGDYVKSNLKELIENIKRQELFTPINLNQFTEDQLLCLGFGKWDDSKLALIPVWIVPFTSEKFVGECISGQVGEFSMSEIDKDTRFGCLAYGVYPAESVNEQA